MIKAIGFRRLLPVANLLLYVGLMCCGNGRWTSSGQADSHAVTVPILNRCVIALNVPAVFAAFGLNAVVFHFQLKYAFLLSIPFVLLLWYPVGCWIDRQVGWSLRRKQIGAVLRDVFLASAVLISVLAVVLFVQIIHRVGPRDPFWMGYGICAWFAFLLTVLAGTVYRRLANSRSLRA